MFTFLIFSFRSIIRVVCNWILCIRIQKYSKPSCDSTVIAASCMHISWWSHLFTQLSSMFFTFTRQCIRSSSLFPCLLHTLHVFGLRWVNESRHHWWWSWGIWDKPGSRHLHFLAWKRYEIWNLQDECFEINEPFSHFRSHIQKKRNPSFEVEKWYLSSRPRTWTHCSELKPASLEVWFLVLPLLWLL